MTGPDVPPRALRLMWGMDEAPRRGPRPGLSLDDIASTAARIADREGLPGASLPKIARELQVGTTSLYRYIETRADLDAAMLDHAYGRPPIHRGRRGWRPRLRSWALANLTVLEAHPWLLDIPAPEPPLGPNRTAWTESGLASFDGSTIPDDDQLSALLLAEIFVRGQALLTRPPGAAAPVSTTSYATKLAAVIDEANYPRLTRALATGAFDRPPVSVTAGLDILFDGLERAWSAITR